MSRNVSLLILSSLLSSAFPSVGWTEICSPKHPHCEVRCPAFSEVLIICNNDSAYYACSHGYRASVSHCSCLSNFQSTSNEIGDEAALNLFGFPTPAIEVTCFRSNNLISPASPASPVSPLLPPKNSSPQAPQSSTPSSPNKTPSTPSPLIKPQSDEPSPNETPPPPPTPFPIPTPPNDEPSTNVVPEDHVPSHAPSRIRNLIEPHDKDAREE